MKKINFTLLVFLVSAISIMAQVPEKINYQAVIRNSSGAVEANKDVTIKVNIVKGSASGSAVFTEEHNVTTTEYGLVNLQIGSNQNGLGEIDWSADTYFLKISVNGTTMGASQILSVPYALYSMVSDSVMNISFDTFATKDMDNEKITNLGTPENGNDAATKAYVDSLEARVALMEEKILFMEEQLAEPEIINMKNGTVTVTKANFYDSGSSTSNYSYSEYYTLTILPGKEGKKVKVTFSSFSVESNSSCSYDYLQIYDGNSTSAALIGKYCGTNSPGTVTATSSTGALTFRFTSDSSYSYSGWAATVTLVD